MSVPFPSTSLYVGDLSSDVSEGHLFDVFTRVAPVASIRVCRDAVTRRSLGYAYVNFHSAVDAEQALNTLHGFAIKGKPARIMWSQRDPSIRKSGVGNIFIKNLDKSIDHLDLYDTFVEFGNILSCKIATDETGASKGYGFVHYETKEMAQIAIDRVNGMMLKGKAVYVGHFTPKKERQKADVSGKFTNVFVKNLDDDVDEKKLREIFSQFGPVTSAVLSLDADGKSKCFGFVNFEQHEDAARAIEAMHNKTLKEGGKVLFVGRAQKKTEREQEVEAAAKQFKYQGVNLYIKNLDDFIEDERLKNEFSPFGNVLSARVMRNEKGISKGFGFVSFSTNEEASRAVAEMNGRLVGTKPLYVALAQKKEIRRAQLEAQFRQRGKQPTNVPAMYPPPPIFYSNPPGFMGYPPILPAGAAIPRNRWEQALPGSAPPGAGGPPQGPFQALPPNFMVPLTAGAGQGGAQGVVPSVVGAGVVPPPGQGGPQQQQNRQSGGGGAGRHPSQRQNNGSNPNRRGGFVQSAGGGRGGGVRDQSPHQHHQHPHHQQQQQHHQLSNAGPALLHMPPSLSHSPLPPQSIPLALPPEQTANAPVLTTAMLAQYPPDTQLSILGEKLFPIIESVQPEHAGKITGMLLEKHSSTPEELLAYLQNHDLLNESIREAVDVLRSASQGGPNDDK